MTHVRMYWKARDEGMENVYHPAFGTRAVLALGPDVNGQWSWRVTKAGGLIVEGKSKSLTAAKRAAERAAVSA